MSHAVKAAEPPPVEASPGAPGDTTAARVEVSAAPAVESTAGGVVPAAPAVESTAAPVLEDERKDFDPVLLALVKMFTCNDQIKEVGAMLARAVGRGCGVHCARCGHLVGEE